MATAGARERRGASSDAAAAAPAATPGASSARGGASAGAGSPRGAAASSAAAAGAGSVQGAVEGPRFTAINPEAFKDGFSVDVLLTYLARDVLKQKLGSRPQLEGGTAPLAVKGSLEKVQRLLTTMDRAEEELQTLHLELSRKRTHLQQVMARQQTTYQMGVEKAEELGAELRTSYRGVEGAANRISQVGIRIGDRLQTAEAVRSRALELVSLLSHLMAFSQLPQYSPSPEDLYRQLPPVFWEDKNLSEAAGLARKLSALTAEAHNAKQRSRLVGADERDMSAAGTKGSLNYTTWHLVGYCNWLEQRVMGRFDRAMARGSVRVMTECAGVMAQFDAEKVLAQRYITSLPVFAPSGEPNAAPAAATPAAAATAAAAAALPAAVREVRPPAGHMPQQLAAALAPFNDLCALLQATLESEVNRVCEVFGNSTQALELFVQQAAQACLTPALKVLLLPEEMGDDAGGKGDGEGSEDEGGSEDDDSEGEDDDDEDDDEEEDDDEDEEEDADAGVEGRGEEGGDAVERELARALGQGQGYAPRSAQPAGGRRRGGKGAAWGQGDMWGGGGRRAPRVPETPETLVMRLQLLTKAHARVSELTTAMEAACAAAGVRNLSVTPALRDGVFLPYLQNYPYPELRWLDMCFQVALSKQAHPEVRASTGQQLIANNREAVARAAALSQSNDVLCAAHVRVIFYGAGPFEEMPGTLLEQLARLVIDGVEHSLVVAEITDPAARAKAVAAQFFEQQAAAAAAAAQQQQEAGQRRGARGDAPPPPQPPKPPPPVTRQSAATQAAQFVSKRLDPPLEAVHAAATVMSSLQAYYSQYVAPHITDFVAEESLCSSGLLLLLRAVEESVGLVLSKVVDAVVIKAELTLLMHQQRSDFHEGLANAPMQGGGSGPAAVAGPKGAGGGGGGGAAMASLGQPTAACLLVVAQLEAMHRAVTAALDGPNLVTFLQEVGSRVHSLLVNHMLQFRYSAQGALRWKGDVTEYVEALRGWEVPGLRDKLQRVQALANVLVVPPESLVGLVDAGLRLDHREALRFVALREDFATARVDGKSLQELFSATSAMDAIISQVTGAPAGAAGGR